MPRRVFPLYQYDGRVVMRVLKAFGRVVVDVRRSYLVKQALQDEELLEEFEARNGADAPLPPQLRMRRNRVDVFVREVDSLGDARVLPR